MAELAGRWESIEGQQDAAFDALFAAEYARVVTIARRVLGDDQEAEDIAQDVFCDFYRRHPATAPYAGAWLHRASAHAALNSVRSRRRRARHEAAGIVERERLETGTDRLLDPAQAVEIAEQRDEVRIALAVLPKKSAAVLILRYSGLSYAEVAAALGVGIGQVGTLLRRAESGLRKEITHDTRS